MKDRLLNKYNLNSLIPAFTSIMGLTRNADYRILNNYLLRMQEKDDLEGLLSEAADCLSLMLGYRLFAFVIKDNKEVDVWMDPALYRKAFALIVKEDLDLSSDKEIRFIGKKADKEDKENAFISRDDLEVKSLVTREFTAYLYLASARPLLDYHDEVFDVLLASLKTALLNHIRIKKLESAVSRDALTGIYNRREFDLELKKSFALKKRYNKDFSLIFFDIDHFKSINDNYSHLAGDYVLKLIAEKLGQEIRLGDLFFRYGGEEFAIILPETSRTQALELAERLRLVIESLNVSYKDSNFKLTASFGLVETEDDLCEKALLARVDSLLYRAKEKGRNRVES